MSEWCTSTILGHFRIPVRSMLPLWRKGHHSFFIIWVSKERLSTGCHILMCATKCCHTGEKKNIGWIDMDAGIQRKKCGMGERFAESWWFWDPNSEWCLSVRCQYPGCSNIISAQTILSADESEDRYREIKCDCCQSTFQVQAKYVKGDPRNIAFVGKLQSQWIWSYSKFTESLKIN